MRVLWRILAIAFALCGAGNAVAQFTGDIAVDLTLDYDSQRVSVVFPSPEIDEGIVAGAGGEYYWRCQQTDIHTGEVIRENFAGIDVGHPNSRFLTFRQISTFIDISGCDHITADLRIYGSNTLTVSGVSVQIAGIRREGELPYVTVNIGHTGDGYDEGDVYSFTVIYTDILGVTQTVRSDEHARLARVFRSVLWRQVGVTRELEGTPHSFVETLIPQPPLSSFLDAPPLPINPVIGDRYLPPCVFESCEPDTSRFENESFDLTPFFFNLGFTVRLDNFTYTLSFKDVANSHTANRDGYTVYMDHIAVELIERFSSFSNPNFFRAYHGYIHRNDMLQVVEPLEILRSHNPIRFAGTPVEEPVSFAEFANTADEELYISFDLAGDRNNGFQAGTRYIWQHRINGSAWQNTEDEFIRGVHFTSPDHFVGAEAGDEIQIRGVLDIEDGWGFRNYLFSPTLSHTDRPPTGDMQFIETGLHAEATITTSLDEIEDPDGEIDVLSYRWQAGNGTVFTDVLFQEYDEATRRLFADNIKNVPYILQSSVFSQEGNSGMRVIAELTDSFFGRATITSGFFLVNPPTEGTVSINGNSLFSDGEIYTLNVDELTDGNGIGTFSYTWYVSIDGGNSYDRRGAFGTTFTLKASHIAEANADMPVLLRADVMHTDADGYTQPLVAFLEEDFPTEGEATINGNPIFAEGESYTVDISRLSDENEIGDFTYEWNLFLNGVLLGALPSDNEEFTIPANFFVDQTPRMFSVNIVHTDLDGYKATLAATLKENIPTQGEITIDGNPSFADGEIYTAITAALSDSNDIGDFTYQWLVSFDDGNNYNEIAGETGESYTLESGDLAGADENTPAWLQVSVVHTDADGYRFTLSASLKQDTPTQGEMTIDGNPLFAKDQTYDARTDSLTDGNGIGLFNDIQWAISFDGGVNYNDLRQNTELPRVYRLNTRDFAGANPNTPARLRVSAVHTDLEGYTQTLTAILIQNIPTQGEITIDGNPMFAAGEIYTAITAALSDSNEIGGFTYQWLVSFDDGNNYNEIAGETGETYTADTADFAGANPNTPIFLGVSAVHTDLDGYAQTITAFLEQDLPTQGDIVLNAIADPLGLGEVRFSVNVDALTDGNDIGGFAYQWFASIARDADYNPISAATDRSYILDRSDFAGAAANEPVRISVSVVHTDLAGYEQSFGDFFVQNPRTEGEITIDGNPMFADGEVYTAITAGLSDRNGIGDFTYQWVISFDGGNNYNTNGILGIDSTYTLRAEDIANADENIPALLGVAAVHTDLDGNTQTLTASFLQDIAGTGSVSISGANSFAAGEKYTAITNIADANVIGTVSYSWQASTDGGTNYNLITDANSESYTLSLADFAGATSANPVHLLLSVVHTDMGGFSEFYLATLIHSDTAAGGSLGIEIQSGVIAEDAVVELDTAGISDINGGGIVSHSWHLDNGAAIVGATAATYILSSANLTLSEIRNGVLHSEVLYRDSFGYETRFSITLFGEGDDEEYDPDNPNELDSIGTGTVAISGTISFAANEKYTADISDIAPNDANGKGTFTYSWHTSTDGGTNYDLISGATLELYTLALSDFAGANANAEVHLRVSVVHTDFGGFDQSYLATLIHSDTAAGGSLGIEIQSGVIAEDAVVELDTAGISDINGGGIISHSWHLDNGAAIVGETSATYTLQAANLTLSEIRNGVLHSEVLYRDNFGYETRFSITLFGEGDDEEYDPNNPNELDSLGTGTVAISGTISFAANEKYTADISDIAPNDANGKGDFAYSWHTSTDGGNNYTQITGATLELYTLALSDFAGANANAEVHLRVSVVHTDFGGFDQSYLATLIHSDTAAGGSLGIGIQSGVIAEDAIVELDTAAISDINGGGIVSHSWHLDNGAAIVGETSATYTLQAANLTLSEIRNGVLHSEVLYRDSFGYETRFSITLFGEGDDEEYDPDNPNELDSMGTGTVAISGTISFAANEKYTADISDIAPNDANGKGDFAYSWQASTDGGNNYNLITDANSESYTLALSDFAGANANAEVHLRVSVVHTDFGGFDQSYLATLIHSDTAAGGSLGIGIQSGVIAEDAIVELDTAAISDINGGGIVSHSWHLDNGAAIAGATAATYTLQAANLTLSEIRNGVLHSEVLYRDSFGYETRFSITLFGEGDDEEYDPNNPNELDSLGTGTVAISGTISFAANERYTADISDIAPNDANGEGDFAYSWHTSTDGGTNYTQITDANSESYTLALSDFAGANANAEVHLRVSVVHTDFGGFDQSYLATLIHSDTAAGGSLGIEIQNGVIAENAVVELDTAGISDINGGGIISHSWHLDNGAAIVGETSATYTLSSANLTLSEIRNGVLHSEVLYRDDFGYETRFSITLFGEGDDEVANPDPNHPGTSTNPVDPSDNPGGEDPDNPGNIFGTGSVSISGANSFAAGEKYTAITNIADANMIGTVSYSWQASTDGGNNYNLITDANSESYTLALSDFAGATSANPVHLLLSVVHTDMGGFSEFYLATLIHSDTAAGGSLGIVAAGLMAGDLVTADAAGLADANGALTISYRWQTGERNTPESFADLVGEAEAVYTIYADDYDSDSRDSLRLIARTADPFGGETEITSAILPINRETEGRISLELVGGEIVAGATIRLRTDAVSDENGGGFEKYYWFINDLLLMEENDDFLVVRSDDLRDIAAGGLRAEAKYVDGIGFTVRLSARLIAAGIVAPSPEEIANWSVVIETEGVAFGEDLARANLIGAEQSDYYEVFYRWRTGVGIAFADERNVGGVGNYHQLEAANFNPQDHLRAIAEVELLSGTFVTLTSAPVQIDYPSIGAVRIVDGELLAPGVVVSADISDVRDANGGVNVVSERWLYADTPVAMARSYTLTEEAVHAGKVFYEATFADAAGFRTSLRAEANVGGEVSSEKAEAIIGAVNAAAIDGLWNALEGHLDSEAGWRANGAPIEDPSQIAAALSRRDENSLHPDSPFALDSFALKESGGEAGEEWSWWAHGSRSRLKGKPIIDGEEVKYHGDYASFHAGMDRQISDTVRAGLAFSADDADLDVEWRKGVDGRLRQNIRSLIPYTEWRPDDLTNVRILAGYGEGDIYLAEHDNASRASARRTLFGIRAARRKDLADNFDITFSGGFDKTRLQTDAIDLPGLQDDLDARTKETHARVRGGHISSLPAKGSLHKEISLRWRSQSVAGDRDSVFDFGIGFNATLPEYFLSFGADGERQLTDSAHERNRFGVYIAYGAGRFAHILETRYDNEIALPQNRWQINTVSEWGVSELLTGVYVEHNGNEDLRIGWESNLLF